VAVAVAAGALTVMGGSTAGAISDTGYYKTTYSDTIWRYFNLGSGIVGRYALTAEQWQAQGSPGPATVGSDVVKYPWSPTLYAVTFFDGTWLWDRLDGAEWARMGRPAPRNAGWIEGSIIYQYGSSSELFLIGEDGVGQKLTPAQWAATGNQPVTLRQSNLGFVRFSNSPKIYLAVNYRTPSESGREIGFNEWVSYGMPTPEVRNA
jgi:hypothetical protein